MNDFIRVPYGSTVHGDEEINAVVEVLKTTTQMSKNVREFEAKVAEKYEHDYGIMVNSDLLLFIYQWRHLIYLKVLRLLHPL